MPFKNLTINTLPQTVKETLTILTKTTANKYEAITPLTKFCDKTADKNSGYNIPLTIKATNNAVKTQII